MDLPQVKVVKIQLIFWRKTGNFKGFPDGSAGTESTCNAGDLGSIPGLGTSPGEGKGCPLQCSGLENPIDRGAWPDTYSPWGRQRSDTTERLSLSQETRTNKDTLHLSPYR